MSIHSMYRAPAVLLALALALPACGGGVPIRVRLDEVAFPLDLTTLVGEAQGSLLSTGVLPGNVTLPELWPASLPDIKRSYALPIPPVPLDLSPNEGEEVPEALKELATVIDLSAAQDAISRIEINKLVLRVERSSLSIKIPSLTLQVADSKDATIEDRRAWFSVGRFPEVPAGAVGDFPFEWIVGGESMLNAQLGDEAREFSLRIAGRVELDTAANPQMPRGKADLRVIVVSTFFVVPENATDVLPTTP